MFGLAGTCAVRALPVPASGRSTRRALVSVWWVADIGAMSEAEVTLPVTPSVMVCPYFAWVGALVTVGRVPLKRYGGLYTEMRSSNELSAGLDPRIATLPLGRRIDEE